MYEEALSKVATAGKMRNLTDRSVSAYSKNLISFFNFTGKDPSQIDMQDVYDYILSKKASRSLHLAVICPPMQARRPHDCLKQKIRESKWTSGEKVKYMDNMAL